MKLRALLMSVAITGIGLMSAMPLHAQPAPKPEKLTVAMHFNVPQLSWYGFYWAQEHNYYKDAGLELEFVYLRGSTLSVQATGAGKTDIGVAAADSSLMGIAEKLPISVIANHLQTDSTGVILNKAKGAATTFKDLAGKTIVTSDTTTLAALLRATLKRNNIADKVNVLSVDAQSVCTLMLSDRADGCTGFSFAQFLQVKAKGVDAQFLPFSSPDFPILGHVILANNDYLTTHDKQVRAFLAATARGYREASADIPKTVEMMARIDPTQPRQTLPDAITIIAGLTKSARSEKSGWGWMDDEAWSNLYAGLVDGKVMQPGLNIAAAYTNKYLPGKP